MKRLLSFLTVIFIINSPFAQTGNYQIAINNFQENYDDEKYDEILNRFSTEMKQALPYHRSVINLYFGTKLFIITHAIKYAMAQKVNIMVYPVSICPISL